MVVVRHVTGMSITCGVPAPTIIRFAQRFGFAGSAGPRRHRGFSQPVPMTSTCAVTPAVARAVSTRTALRGPGPYISEGISPTAVSHRPASASAWPIAC